MLLRKCLFTILLILEVTKIFEKQVAAEKGHIDFYIGGLRHFHTFALVVEENFMHKLSAFYRVFLTKTRLKNITKLNHANIKYKGKCFEDNVKRETF